MSRLSDPIPTIRVLHIDDEASYLEITKIFVEESNPFIQVQSCISPGQAISEITKGAFDCVLSDYLMDEMDGLELACKILEISDIPIIMYTGQGSEEIAERAFEIGIDDYIMKEATSSHYQVLAKRIVSAVERKRTLDLLSESEKKYRRLWEDSSDGLVLVDKLSGGILDFNEEFIWQTGRGRGELQSLKLWDILPPNTRESIRERFLEERDEGSVTSAKITFQKPSGEIVDIDLLSREIKIGDQEVLQGRCRDITEQKRYWERLETLHKHASELSRTKDEKEVSRFTLDGIEEIFGFQKMSFSLVQGMIIRPVEIRSNSPLSRTEIPLDGVGLIAKVARTGESMLISDVLKETDYYMARESTRSELTVPVKIGDEVVAVINIESSELDAISPEDQRLVEIFAEHIASAISINRESSKLRISEEKYRSLFESTHEGVLVSGPDGRYTSANPAAAAILGYDSPDDIIGLSAVDFYAEPEQRDEVYEALMEKGYISDYEHEIKRKDGSRGLISTNVTLHKTDDGGILRSEVFFRDITDRKIVEEELKEHASSLEELVERRSQELVEAEKMVTAGKIASMVGHDLRGPLSNIKNSLYLIERKPEMLEKLKPLIFNSVDYALNMLEELRLITRTAEPTLMETNLGNLVQRAVDEAQIPTEVEVETQIGESLASAQLDRTQIRRVLNNLIRNAVEAMSDGGTLILSLETEDGDLILDVEDTGNGIPEEDKPNIFTPFYTTKSNGMGLGLAYCKRSVEAHGGAITWVSKIGVGTTFTVKLPLKPD